MNSNWLKNTQAQTSLIIFKTGEKITQSILQKTRKIIMHYIINLHSLDEVNVWQNFMFYWDKCV